MPDVLHVHTNLMGAPCFEDTLHKGHISQTFQHPVVGNGMLTLVVGKDGHLHTVFRITPHVAYNRTFVLLHIPPDESTITAFSGFIEKLEAEIGFCIRCFGNHQQAGCIFIDTVHKPHVRVIGIIIGNIFHVPGNGIDKRAMIVAMSGMHHQPGRFVNHHKELVFIDYIKGNVFGNNLVFIAGTIHHNRYHVQRFYLVTALDRFIICHYKPGIGSLLYTVTRSISQAVEQILVHTHHLLPFVHNNAEVLVKLRLITDRFYIVQYIVLYVVR